MNSLGKLGLLWYILKMAYPTLTSTYLSTSTSTTKLIHWYVWWKNTYLLLRQVFYRITIQAASDRYTRSNQYSLSGIILVKRFSILRQVSYRMTISLFTVCTGNTYSAVSPLPEDFYDNFGGDHIADDRPHDRIMRQVVYRNGTSCGAVTDRTSHRSPVMMNLKLHHKQMHYRRSPF